ncbi:kinase interacting family protein [Striga hermonthica]|uniref:Kinase interacting family protein n=1 Tax=Striga hermonthica TaxID=68872 RepID=A0A9N7MTB9_STRHE|nr:kinase interacting family protein [Striga hermonthica]
MEGNFDMTNLTVAQVAEKIDQLVNRVIGMETSVSSQMVLVNTLWAETEVLNLKIRGLEEENDCTGTSLLTNFAEARPNLDCLSEKLSSAKPDDTPPDENSIRCLEDLCTPVTEVIKDVKEVGIKPVVKSGLLSDEKPIITEKITTEERHSCENGGKMEENTDDEDVTWQEMLLSGMDDREKILLKEYTTILRNYKDVKRKLVEIDKKEKDIQFESVLQIRELKNSIQKKDDKIQTLRHRLFSKEDTTNPAHPVVSGQAQRLLPKEDTDTRNDVPCASPGPDEANIDAILDEKLDFWLRFSNEFHQIQKFRSAVHDLEKEIALLSEKWKPHGSSPRQAKSDARSVYKHLREIRHEVGVWVEQSGSLRDELKVRFESLCGIQDEITRALREDKMRFSNHQAAMFQGEVLNMKRENNKVRKELSMGSDHVLELQLRIEKTLRKLKEEFEMQGEGVNRPHVPLRFFLFGTKQKKKQKRSIFSYIHLGRRYQVVRASISFSTPKH